MRTFNKKRDFCVLDMRVGRKLNGIRKEQGIVDLPAHLRRKLEQIIPAGGGRNHNGELFKLINIPVAFQGQLKDILDCIELQAGPLAKDLFGQIRLMKRVEMFYKLIILAMQDRLSQSPNLRFKILIDKELPPKFYELLMQLFACDSMDVRVEVMQIHFIDEIIDECSEEYPVLRDIFFKVKNEMIVRPFAHIWQSGEKVKK